MAAVVIVVKLQRADGAFPLENSSQQLIYTGENEAYGDGKQQNGRYNHSARLFGPAVLLQQADQPDGKQNPEDNAPSAKPAQGDVKVI